MGRPEAPIAGDDLVEEFARDLRQLRQAAGEPTYRAMGEATHFSYTTLSKAAAGKRFPTLAVTLAYVRACRGEESEWARRWTLAAGREVDADLRVDVPTEEPVLAVTRNRLTFFTMRSLGPRLEIAVSLMILMTGLALVLAMHLTWPGPQGPSYAVSASEGGSLTFDLKPFEINDISGAPVPLVPGAIGVRQVRLTNPNSAAIVVEALSAVPGQPIDASHQRVKGCPAGVITVEPVKDKVEIPAGGAVEVEMTVRVAEVVPPVCAGLVFPLTYSGRAKHG
ncbi:helix-turn-helix domain-containing protein [Lentzea sp. NBC_00516]|uniref:helix-turn-helix domain-containing protein n=1 Tax=Lentzea sp. NBC_00516 TaxID=2903582 RepID=UPI002E81291E|nr:helix-turn-helix transcriptional regulator [Lentzea sp. NBC_00516]WUD28909.1 helix-turn-helix domain-containing protein [Lentzea sp. NBC_00516]